MRVESETAPAVEKELRITRLFAAPQPLVYQMWADGRQMSRWACPDGFTITHSEGDVRPGGAYRTCMRSPDGVDHWLGGVYREVVENTRLVFTHVWDTADGKPGHQTVVTVEFSNEGGKTRMDFHQAEFKSVESRDGHRGGWTESFDHLEKYLTRPTHF